MKVRILACVGVAALGLLAIVSSAEAQLRRPRADVTPFVEGAPTPGATWRVGLKVTLPEGLHTQSNAPRDPTLIPTVLTIDAPPGVTLGEISWPRPTELKQVGQDQPLIVFEREFVIGVQLALAANVQVAQLSVPAHLRYQACDANLCYPPATADVVWGAGAGSTPGVSSGLPPAGPKGGQGAATNDLALLNDFEVAGTTGGYQGASDFLTFIRNAEAGVKERGLFEGRGPFAILLLVLIGGLALNLTPCVLPMIPINLAIIGAGAQASSRGRGFLLGSAYGGAMAVVYGILGVVVILTAGTFGTINASPWFNLGIAALFIVLGLAMFDILIIDFSGYSARFNSGASRGGVVLAFSMGAVAALLAGACVAPVVIQVVLFSSNLYSTGTKIALALPFFLGVGMAIPWPIAGAGIASLPKPGMWMVRVKEAFGVFILATAAYYGYEAYSIFSNRWVDPKAVASSVEAQIKAGWHASLAEGLAVAQREDKPVLIDMWATWCKNCLTMDKTTLENADVKTALSTFVKVKFQAEDPDVPPAKTLMQRFDAVGLPTYVILKPRAPSPKG